MSKPVNEQFKVAFGVFSTSITLPEDPAFSSLSDSACITFFHKQNDPKPTYISSGGLGIDLSKKDGVGMLQEGDVVTAEVDLRSPNEGERTLAFKINNQTASVIIVGIPPEIYFGIFLSGKVVVSVNSLNWGHHPTLLLKEGCKRMMCRKPQKTVVESYPHLVLRDNAPRVYRQVPINSSNFSDVSCNGLFTDLTLTNRNFDDSTIFFNSPITKGIHMMNFKIVSVPLHQAWEVFLGVVLPDAQPNFNSSHDKIGMKKNSSSICIGRQKRCTEPWDGSTFLVSGNGWNGVASEYRELKVGDVVAAEVDVRGDTAAERTVTFSINGVPVPGYIYGLPESVVVGISLVKQVSIKMISYEQLYTKTYEVDREKWESSFWVGDAAAIQEISNLPLMVRDPHSGSTLHRLCPLLATPLSFFDLSDEMPLTVTSRFHSFSNSTALIDYPIANKVLRVKVQVSVPLQKPWAINFGVVNAALRAEFPPSLAILVIPGGCCLYTEGNFGSSSKPSCVASSSNPLADLPDLLLKEGDTVTVEVDTRERRGGDGRRAGNANTVMFAVNDIPVSAYVSSLPKTVFLALSFAGQVGLAFRALEELEEPRITQQPGWVEVQWRNEE